MAAFAKAGVNLPATLKRAARPPRGNRAHGGRLSHDRHCLPACGSPTQAGGALKRCIPCRNELAPSSLSFWTFSLVSRPMPSPDQSDHDPNGTPE